MTKTSTNKDTKMLTVNIPADMLDRFKQECKEDNLTMSEAIKGFIQSYLDGNLEAMQTGMIGNNTTAKQIEEAVERKIDDYISNEIDQVVTRHLETDLDVKLDSILEKKLDKYLDNKLESRLKAKLDTNLDTNLEHNLEFDTDNNLDEKLEPQAQETIEDDTDNNLDSNLEVTSTTLQNNEPPTTEDEGSAIAQTETPEKQLANDDRLLNAIAQYLPDAKLKQLADIFLELLKEYGIEEKSLKFPTRAEAKYIKSFLGIAGRPRPKEGSKYYRAANILLEAYQIAYQIAEPQNES